MGSEHFGRNIGNPVKEVIYHELERSGRGLSSSCPVCPGGILPLARDEKTFVLSEHDRCLACGQIFRYLDIELLRKRERPS